MNAFLQTSDIPNTRIWSDRLLIMCETILSRFMREIVCFGHIISPISTRPHSRRISKCRNNLQTSRQMYVIGFRSCRKYSAWQTCKSWKTTIILTVIIILPSNPLSCFSEWNLIRLAAWHILTPKSSKIDCPRHNNPQKLQIFVISRFFNPTLSF